MEALYGQALDAVRARVTKDGKLSNELIETEQHAAHGLSWFATYVQGLRELLAYADRLSAEGAYGEIENLLTRIGFSEYLAQVFGGIPMSQGEFVRLSDFGLTPDAGRRAPHCRGRPSDRLRHHRAEPRAPRRADRPSWGRRDHRRHRPRRDAGGDPQRDAQIRGRHCDAARA